MTLKAIYPGTFDPITYGHLDIVKRAAKIFSEVTVVVMNNPRKKPFFTLNERLEMIKEATKDVENIKVDSHSGLLVQYVKEHSAKVVIRGLRALEDFEYEFEMALANREMYPELETIYLMTDLKYLFVSSSMVKEIAQFKGELNKWVPPIVEKRLIEKFQG
ncbi:pantetheine-phosphate adenylyltransferase [Mesoaciditoga lauensis]|uniref:pantetheine-phosphate adenylyltransferase n=1 Tax=Mesoaciditoga lauensis TaxID=1495039 RepID=UPI0009DDE434